MSTRNKYGENRYVKYVLLGREARRQRSEVTDQKSEPLPMHCYVSSDEFGDEFEKDLEAEAEAFDGYSLVVPVE
jgi:hypothetical protein